MNEENRFNLIEEPWIPIIGKGLVSLKEIFLNSELLEIGGTPIEKISLMRLFLAIAQSACTPRDDAAWEALGEKEMAKRCLAYLEKWQDTFWLFGKSPFLQFPQIRNSKMLSYADVFPEVASGNTTVLTHYQMERPLAVSDKALLLVTLMGFGMGGKKVQNTISLSPGYEKKATGAAGTHLGYLGYLHTFFWGETLLKTIWQNLYTQESIEAMGYLQGVGIAPWEKMPQGENCQVAKGLKESLMGRLVPLSRLVFLAEDGLYYSDGLVHPNHKEAGMDPMITVNRSKNAVQAVWVDPNKRPWRWLTAFLGFISEKSTYSGWDCTQIKMGLSRLRKCSDQIGIWSGGLRVSSNSGEQFISGDDDYVESKLFFSQALLGEEAFHHLENQMANLEELASILYKSVKQYFKKQSVDGSKIAGIAVLTFWQMAEGQFDALSAACGAKDLLLIRKKRGEFFQLIEKIFDKTCPKDSVRQLDAWVQSRPRWNKHNS